MENAEKFPYMIQYHKEDEKETKKLILVEIYCFLAEKFNFNINEFYSEAFNVPVENKSSKKVKKSSWSLTLISLIFSSIRTNVLGFK